MTQFPQKQQKKLIIIYKSNGHYTDLSCFKRNPSDRDVCPCITLVFTLDQPLAILSTKPTNVNLRYQVENSLM